MVDRATGRRIDRCANSVARRPRRRLCSRPMSRRCTSATSTACSMRRARPPAVRRRRATRCRQAYDRRRAARPRSRRDDREDPAHRAMRDHVQRVTGAIASTSMRYVRQLADLLPILGDFQPIIAQARTRARDLRVARQRVARFSGTESPQVDQRLHGHIERAVRIVVQVVCRTGSRRRGASAACAIRQPARDSVANSSATSR